MFIEKMKSLKIITLLFLIFGFCPNENFVHASTKNPKSYKVLSTNNKNLSIANVKYYLKEGDEFIKNGDLDEAKDYVEEFKEFHTYKIVVANEN